MNKQEIFLQLTLMLHDLFELELDDIKLESKLYEELDLDSIDAVDLIVRLQNLTQIKFTPEEFKAVKTVGDVVDIIYIRLQTD